MPQSLDDSRRDDDQPGGFHGIPGFSPGQSERSHDRQRQTDTPPGKLDRQREARAGDADSENEDASSSEENTGPGRPRKNDEALSERMTVRLTASQMKRIEQVAADMDVSPSVAAREIIGQKSIDQKARQLRRVRDQLSEIGAKVRGIDDWVRKASGEHGEDIARRQKKILTIIYEKLKTATKKL